MESTVTAIEMRRKFGGILDRVVQKGEHITIMRGHQPLATLVPAHEHERQCRSRDRIRTVQEVLGAIEAWHQKNPAKTRRMVREKSVDLIRKMRRSRWSSSTPR